MKKTIDLFSAQAKLYKKYRPHYPGEFYNEILGLVKNRSCCWDCGTGNGQVAQYMAGHFKKVYATDISETQLKQAEQRPNIVYKKERSEATSFEDNSFNLITVAQAIHWFDFKPFYREVRRTAKNNGVIAIWGYGLLTIDNSCDEIIEHFYRETIGPYWNEQRRHIDSKYETIDFPFDEIKLSKPYQIETQMNLSQLEGYFNSWSSVQNYKKKNKENPVDDLIKELRKYWGNQSSAKTITFPIFTKIGMVEK